MKKTAKFVAEMRGIRFAIDTIALRATKAGLGEDAENPCFFAKIFDRLRRST
jgi:hypothetical protein